MQGSHQIPANLAEMTRPGPPERAEPQPAPPREAELAPQESLSWQELQPGRLYRFCAVPECRHHLRRSRIDASELRVVGQVQYERLVGLTVDQRRWQRGGAQLLDVCLEPSNIGFIRHEHLVHAPGCGVLRDDLKDVSDRAIGKGAIDEQLAEVLGVVRDAEHEKTVALLIQFQKQIQ